MTSGMQTSEFWLAVLVIVAGTVLMLMGNIDQDTWKWSVSIPSAGYAIGRGLAKNEAR